MSARAEFACFAALALAAHLGLWAGMADTGSEASGAKGEALVSLKAASGEIAALVEAWNSPVEAAQQMDAPQVPPQEVPPPMATLEPPAPESVPEIAPRRQPAIAPMAPETPPAPPQTDTQSLRPPVMEAAPKSSARPRERPEPPVEQPPLAAPRPAANQPQGTTQSWSAAPQTAAGQNGGTNAGRSTQERAATLSPAARQSLMAGWGASIRAQVERRKSYPRGSRASGTTVLRITVASSGSLAGVSLARSSGAPELDQAAIRAVHSARFPAAPKELGAGTFQFNLPLAFAGR